MVSYGMYKLGVDGHAQTDGRTDTYTQADAGNDNTWRPKLASDKKDSWNESRIIPNINICRYCFKMVMVNQKYVNKLMTF